MSGAIRVLLVDDQPLFLEGLRTLLSLHQDLEVVAERANGREALKACGELSPDVVLMDLNMPEMDGVEATRLIAGSFPRCRVLTLTTFDDDERVFEALRAGAAGYLLKDTPSESLVDAIKTVHAGNSFLQPSIAAKVLAEFNRLAEPKTPKADPRMVESLSSREREVLRCLAKGQSNKEIASTLDLAEGTVKNHVSNILGKLGVLDRTQAALLGRELGLV
ncbi:response regulator transcription factor [Pelagicoccus sp. SDUM812003]|uniref:response regulator transcription factor n=1 Tax=Pelagicoccus sp. SDUM812003 TaxID=3041267 RepID=UPI00280EA918|nr:response regulator transcription factor [Pelagicoccus sp. SDUM812003]MDQ8201963.1 response regulator transcription factor [Pelagicoccus sp. SDUM812003]